jgi:AcrR family transcriptional regulator
MVTNKREGSQVGRPRSFENDDIFNGTARALTKLGYEGLTLNAVAAEVGCTGPALIRRFGSKRHLIKAYLKWSNELANARFDSIRAEHSSPLAALRARFQIPTNERPDEIADAVDYANIVVFYLAVWTDETLRPTLELRQNLFEEQIARLLQEAVDTGELVECDVPRLSRTLLTGLTGAALRSINARDETIEDRLGQAIDDILYPYLAAAATVDRKDGPESDAG